MPRSADFVERMDQGILAVGPKRKVEVKSGPGWRATRTLPAFRDCTPRVFRVHVVPMW
jgi:hypothetical protein